MKRTDRRKVTAILALLLSAAVLGGCRQKAAVKEPKENTLFLVGEAKRTIRVGQELDLEVEKAEGVYDRDLEWEIEDREIVDFEDLNEDINDDDIELIGRKKGKTIVACKNLKENTMLCYTVEVTE